MELASSNIEFLKSYLSSMYCWRKWDTNNNRHSNDNGNNTKLKKLLSFVISDFVLRLNSNVNEALLRV